MPESPLDVQIRTLRQIAQASPAARVEATRLADALEAETIGNRRAAAQDAFQAIAPRYVGQQQAPAARTAAVAGLQEQLGAAFSVPTMQADRLRFAEAEGRAEGVEQGPVGGALAGLESGGTRLLGGIMQRSKDAGTTWYDPYLDVLPEAQAHVEQRVAASPVFATVGQAAPYLGAALAGAPGIALLTASEGVSSYGEGRQMGLDPDEASKRAAGQALLTAGGMLATPFSRAAAASNAAALGRGLLGREALEIGAGTLDALPQSLVMDVGGGAADVLQARSLGLAGGELEQAGKTRMATLPTAPELLLADVGMEALLSPFRVHGHRVATRQEQVRVASEQGALRDAATFIQGQRIADNQADLERQLIRGDRPPPEQILGGSMLEEGPPLPPGIVEGGMELTRPQVEGGVPSALARPVRPLEQAPARPDLPEIGQRMATQEASRLGVEERQRQELARLEDEARQLEADLLGRNRVSDVAYFEQQIAAAEKAAEEAALRQRPQERTAALRQRMEAQRELAAVRKEAEAYQTRVRANQERQKRLRELQAKALPTYEQTRQPGFMTEAARAAEPPRPAPIAPEAAPTPRAGETPALPPLEAPRAPAVEAPAPPVAESRRGAPSFLDRARAEAPKTPVEQRHPDSLVATSGRPHPVGKGRPREDAMAQEAAKNADESFRILDDIGRAVPDMDVVASGTQEELFGARNPHDTPPAAPRSRSLPPAPAAGLPVGTGAADGPAGPGRPGAAPRIDPRRLGKLPDAVHQRLVDDAAGVRGVHVERDAEGHTFLRFDGTDTRVRIVYDTRPATERDARSWLESAIASGRQEDVGLVAAAVASAARKLNLPPPGWSLNPAKLTAETLRDNWNRALKGKDTERVVRQAMEDSPVMAVALRPGDLAGYEHAIGLTPAYEGRQIQEETWHLGWRVLPDTLKQEVIDRLPVHQREAARRSSTAATEAATALLARLWREHAARGAKPRSWFGRVIAAMRTALQKLAPFLAPKPDRVRELAREFGEGRVFRRLDEAEGGGEAEAQSVQLSARRKMAAETDEGRNTWEEVSAQAEAIIRDGPRLNAMIEKLDKPVGQRDLTQAEARALTMLAEEASLRMLGRAANAMRDPNSTLAGLSQDVLDQAAWATLALQANRDAGQRLRNLANDPYAPNLSKVMAPFTEMSGGWKQRALKARTKAAKAQVTKEWEAWKDKILTKLAARGFDLRDPAMARDIDGMEADSVANLRFEIAQEIKRSRGWKERWADYSTGRLASELTMRNLLTLGSPIPQIPTSAYFGLRGQMRAAVESLSGAVDGLDPELLAGFGGRAQAAQHIGQSVIQGIRFGIESVLTGDSIAKGRLTGRTDYGADTDSGEVMAGMEYVSVLQDVGDQLKDLTKVPGIGAALRVGMGPGLEAVRFIDDVTWTTTFEMTRRTLAAAKAKAQGGELLDYIQDQTIVDDAARHADRVTQRSRPDEKTIGGKVFKLVEGLRSPTLGGVLSKGAWRFLYWPPMHLMPIFRTVALLTGEAGRVLGAPVRGAQGLKTLRLLRNADELQAQALEEGIAPAQLRRRLTDRYLDQMTDFVVGTLAYTLAATLGQSLLPAPEGEQTDPAEARAKELLRPTGDTPVGGLQRLSPVYETAMGAAATREALKKILAEPSWRTSKEAAVEAMTATGRAILEKPLLSGAKALISTPRDPVTGEKQSLPDYFAEQARRQLLGFGSPYRHLARASETRQTRSADPAKVTGLTEERVTSYGLTGETRSAPGGPAGIVKRGLFGNVPKAEGNERRVLEMIEKLNTQLDEKLAREAPVGTRPKPGEGGWWPDTLYKDLPSEEDRRFVKRMSVKQQEELNRLAGERWWKMLSPQLDRIEKMGADNPKAALTIMQRMRSAAARAARYEVERAR